MTRQELRVKEYLSRAFYDELNILSLIDELEKIDSMMLRTNTINENDKVQGGKKQSLEDLIIKFLDYKTKLQKQIEKSRKEVEDILEVIDKLEDARFRTLLVMRYIRHMKWDEIAKAMSFDIRWATRLHLKALREIVKLKII